MADFILYKPKQAIVLPASFQVPSDVEFKEVEFRGKGVKVVKDNLKTYYALKDRLEGLDCPIYRYYDWPLYKSKFPAMSHQSITASFTVEHPKSFVGSQTGTGKTLSLLYAFDYLKKEGVVDKLLIISPISVMNVWPTEVFGTMLWYQCVTLYGSATKRRELMKTQADIYITNFDGVKILEKDLLEWVDEKTYIIVDECSKLCNPSTQFYASFEKVMKKAKYVTLASATPTSKGPDQAWGIARLINPNTPKYFSRFRDLVQYKVNMFKWANKPNCNDVVNEYLQPGIVFHKDQCLDLPPMTINHLKVDMTDEQQKIYKRVRKDMAAQLASGTEVTATNAAHTIGLLRQTALGVVKVGENEYEPIDKNSDGTQKITPRIQALLDLIDAEEDQIIIAVPFKGAILHYYSIISKYYKTEYVNGDVGRTERNDIFDRFQNTREIKVLLCHDAVASHGVNLHNNCSHLVMSGPIWSADNAIQLRGRIERAGSKKPMTITRLYSTSMEKSIYQTIEERTLNQEELIHMYKIELEETT